jgi:hypothetical protein
MVGGDRCGVAVAAGSAQGCPVCGSATGEAVRAGIFDGSFWATLGEVVLPIPVTGAIMAVLYRILP